MKEIGKYTNGNYTTTIYEDGTKVWETEDDEFISEFAESIDLKITNRCDNECEFCHENSDLDGKHADIMNEEFINTLHPYQELAIGGGNVLEHPDLIHFLRKLKSMNVIANMTIKDVHFVLNQNTIQYIVNNELIHGLGISVRHTDDSILHMIKQYDNAVIHVIDAFLTPELAEKLYDKDLKLLILGYKNFGRGNDFYEEWGMDVEWVNGWLKENLKEILPRFKVVSFDNLAIEQLDVKNILSDKEWEEFYFGNDGTHTFYIDAVERKFGKSSTTPKEERYDLLNSVDEMFNKVKQSA